MQRSLTSFGLTVETMPYVFYTAHSYLFHNLPECIVQPYIGSQCWHRLQINTMTFICARIMFSVLGTINESIFVFIFLILLPISLSQRRQQSSVSLEELIKRKIDPLGFASVSPLRVSPFVTSRITWPTAQWFIPWKFFLVAWNHCGAVSLGNPLHFCWIMQLAKQSLCLICRHLLVLETLQ